MILLTLIKSNNRDRVHDHRDQVAPLYGIIDCAFWEFCEFSNEYSDFFVAMSNSSEKTSDFC